MRCPFKLTSCNTNCALSVKIKVYDRGRKSHVKGYMCALAAKTSTQANLEMYPQFISDIDITLDEEQEF